MHGTHWELMLLSYPKMTIWKPEVGMCFWLWNILAQWFFRIYAFLFSYSIQVIREIEMLGP